MRIISGTHKGRHFNAPKNINVRPTTDLAKEALFNILANRIDFESIRVLDLYSGLGGISLEFASRGCTEVFSIDVNPRCTSFIKKTTENFGMKNIRVINSSSFSFLKNNKIPFDLIFADPPYDIAGTENIPNWVFENNNLTSNGLLIIEHPAGQNFMQTERLFEHRIYGRVNFSFFK